MNPDPDMNLKNMVSLFRILTQVSRPPIFDAREKLHSILVAKASSNLKLLPPILRIALMGLKFKYN